MKREVMIKYMKITITKVIILSKWVPSANKIGPMPKNVMNI